MFVCGLVSFLIAHLLYIRAFLSQKLSFKQIVPVGAGCLLYFVFILAILLPYVEAGLLVPVIIYGCAICTMLYLAIIRFFSEESIEYNSGLNGLVGSIFFVLSDSILAVDKFRAPIENAKTMVMVTYYLGQTFIGAATSHVSERKAA